jgi:PKD repeat protein
MKRILHLSFVVLFLSPVFDLSAQDGLKYCGTSEAYKKLLNSNPVIAEEIERSNKELEEYTQNYIQSEGVRSSRGTVYTIPVVFHVIHNYGVENISDDQVRDAVRVLNEDFQLLNADISKANSAFQGITGNSEIRFVLAQKDPNGNCTNGIVRKASMETYKGVNEWGNTSTSDVSRWPRAKYLNVWVVGKIESGAAGYTYKPGSVSGNANMDGIVILHNYVGSTGTGTPTRSRALTHEVGHWLNLDHTWGGSNSPGDSGNCSMDDNVSDTPNTMGWTSCNTNGSTCGSLDNVQNFMEYSYCSVMFTAGQSTRMRSALTSSTASRSSLWASSNLISTGTEGTNNLCKAEFESNRTIICAGQSITFSDLSYNGQNSWSWSFPGATTTSSSESSPTVMYSSPGTYDVSLSVGNGTSSKSSTKSKYITVLSATGKAMPFTEGFENSNFSTEWMTTNYDGGLTWQEVSGTSSSGSKSLKLNNYSNSIDQVDVFESKTINLSGFTAVNVSFKVAYAMKASGNTDALKVYVSSNCGQSWALRLSRSGTNLANGLTQASAFTPTANQWQEITLSNLPTSYLVSNFRIKFEFTSGGGNNIYLDDINIYDASVTGIKNNISKALNFEVFPNPMEENTTIAFELPNQSNVQLSLFDLLGREAVSLVDNNLNSGEYKISLSKSSSQLGKGIYFVRLSIGNEHQTRRIVVN